MNRFILVYTSKDDKNPYLVLGDPNKDDIEDICVENDCYDLKISHYRVLTKEEALEYLFNEHHKKEKEKDSIINVVITLGDWESFYRCYSGFCDNNDPWFNSPSSNYFNLQYKLEKLFDGSYYKYEDLKKAYDILGKYCGNNPIEQED